MKDLRGEERVRELCENIREILDLLNQLAISRDYLDKNLVPTSEGMKIIRRAIKISREKNMPCTSVIEKLERGFHYLYNLYECYRSALPECLEP
ncbi:MAG: hypothetical protein ABWJ42_02750 [Sulfolobales archaeon]